MSIDYDAPRVVAAEEASEQFHELQTEKSAPEAAAFDLDEGDLVDSFESPGADLAGEELLVHVIPVRTDEFTCISCFLVHHRSQLARTKDGNNYCHECEG